MGKTTLRFLQKLNLKYIKTTIILKLYAPQQDRYHNMYSKS
jgi:hypothetical protein